MKHPEPSEWMAFLYGEVTREERIGFDAHLAVCPECVRRVSRWRETMGSLDTAAVPARRVPNRIWRPLAQWAAAAAVVLGVGFVLGRHGTVSEAELNGQLGTLRTQWRQDLASQRAGDLREIADATVRLTRQENQELLAEFLERYQQVRLDDQAAWFGALREIDQRYSAEAVRLREGLASLASSTGTGFEQTQTQMRLLAGNLDETHLNPNQPQNP